MTCNLFYASMCHKVVCEREVLKVFDIPKYEPVKEKEVVLYEMSEAEKECNNLMGLHLMLSELRDRYDFSVPKSISYPLDIKLPSEGVLAFNDMMCSSVTVDEWLSEKLDKDGVFPDCVCIYLDEYGTLPLALYETLDRVCVNTCKDVLVGLPVWVMDKNNESI